MSYERIISAYEHCRGNKAIKGPAMSVLVALAHRANESRHNACFPSMLDISELTHFDISTIKRGRTQLKKLGLINWTLHKDKGVDHCVYYLTYPSTKPKRRYEMVESQAEEANLQYLSTNSVDKCQAQPSDATEGGAERTTGGCGAPHEGVRREPWGGAERPTNIKENKTNIKPNPSVGLGDVQFQVSLPKVDAKDEPDIRWVMRNPIPCKAMKLCKVWDKKNGFAFASVINKKSLDDVLEELHVFESELKAEGRGNIENLAAVLMKRLQGLRDNS